MANNILTEVDDVTLKMIFIFKIMDGIDAQLLLSYGRLKNSSVWIWTLSIIRTSELASYNAEFYSAVVNSLSGQFFDLQFFFYLMKFMNTHMYTVLYGFENGLTWQ